MNQLSSKRNLFFLTALLIGILLLVSLGVHARPSPEGEPLTDIRSIETLRSQFNRDEGKIRLILLLSPT